MFLNVEIIITAFLLGIAGSFHCVGMCGPIALAVPIKDRTTLSRISSILFYNSGRIITYSLLGLFFGFVGKSFVIAGWQQGLSIGVGMLILLGLALGYFRVSFNIPFVSRGFSFIRNQLGASLRQKTYRANWMIGILNGLLPCGLVYAALAGAIATGSAPKGTLFMAFFGLGTVPLMMALQFFKGLISVNVRNLMRKSVPVYVALLACVLILRGLNLGIPYLSPELSKTEVKAHNCCHRERGN